MSPKLSYVFLDTVHFGYNGHRYRNSGQSDIVDTLAGTESVLFLLVYTSDIVDRHLGYSGQLRL